MAATDNQGLLAEIDAEVRPVIAADGYDLILVELTGNGGVLRMYVDKDDGVGIDDCTRVSHLVGDLLDASGLTDRVPGEFRLEVSSPGLDRPLVRPDHFLRFIGQQAKVSTKSPQHGGRRNFAGVLTAAAETGDGAITLDVDGEALELPYQAIHRARLVPQF